jgi:rSAM/selenodomain-associated transferase 1
MNSRALVLFAKEPIPGRCKTRMTPPLSPEQAADLSLCFIKDALKAALAVRDVDRYLYFTPEDSKTFFQEVAPRGFNFIPQQGKNLKERSIYSDGYAFARGHSRMVQMGTDTPQTRAEDIEAAFDVLEEYDMGIGPARDGGYYMLSLSKPASGIYDHVVMGSDTVFRQMMENAKRLGLRVKRLPEWIDADTYQDLLDLAGDPGLSLGIHTQAYLSSRMKQL